MLQDRRQYQRLAPRSPQLVLLDECKYSLLFDLSEGGLALEGFTAKNPHDVISLEFDLPEGSGCIQARAEIAWTSESGYRTGLRFLDIADTSRQHLREWISSASAERAAVLENELAQPTFAPNPLPESVGPIPPQGSDLNRREPPGDLSLRGSFDSRSAEIEGDEDAFGNEGSSGHLAAIFIGAVLMSCVAFLMGYYWHAGRVSNAKRTVTAASIRPADPSVTPPLPPATPPSAAPPAVSSPGSPAPLDASGYVLQVGAMANESNADALTAKLRQKNFPAFVFKHTTDSLYRVAVGPFRDSGSAAKTRTELERQGFTPLLKSWTPE